MLLETARGSAGIFFLLSMLLALARFAHAIDGPTHVAAMVSLVFIGMAIRKRASGLNFSQFLRFQIKQVWGFLLSILQLEKRVHCSFFGSFSWVGQPPSNGDQVFTLKKAVDHPAFCMLLIFLAFLEMPIGHLLVYYLVDSSSSLLLHLAIAYFNIYGVVWVISDWRAVRRTAHVLSVNSLKLQLGWRFSATIPVADILDVSVPGSPLKAWVSSAGIVRGDVRLVSPLDEPNLVLELQSQDNFRGILFEHPIPRYLALFVDDPMSLKAALVRAIDGKND